MGSFDCYCALCSGPLGIGSVSLGSTKVKDLRKRRSKLRAEKRRPTDEILDSGEAEETEDPPEEVDENETRPVDVEDLDVEDLDVEDIHDVDIPPSEPETEPDDTWSQASDLSMEEDFDLFHNTDQTDSMYEYYEEYSYDPSVSKFENFQWINRCRCLAFNTAATGVTKAFISGRGQYDDYGSFRVLKEGSDANDTGEDHYSCYFSSDPNDMYAFPFHEACYKILSRRLGCDDEKGIDKDVLYSVMKQNGKEYGRCLDLNYGGIQGMKQFWECLPGEEYAVCDPGPRSGFEEVLQSMIPARIYEWAPMPLDFTLKVSRDPFSSLPYDILHGIVGDLSTQDTISLMNASWHVLISTRNSGFWGHVLRRRVLPWFWELDSLLATATLPSTLNHKHLYLWLDRATTPESVMTGPFMGIANRRRIWAVCGQLEPSYKERISPDEQAEPDDEEAGIILRSAMSLHMPLVLYPEPRVARTTSTQFIRSWDEINHPCDWDTYWNADRALVGIAVTFNSIQRVFGSTHGFKGQSLHISSGDWVHSIIVFISDVDMLSETQDRSHYRTAMDVSPAAEAGIDGMSVTLTSGKSNELRSSNWRSKNRRPFLVLPKMYLIGLTGQIAADGVISRLGLLQAPRPGTDLQVKPRSYKSAQKMLWASSASSLAYSAKECRPIWDNPKYRLRTFPFLSYELQIPSDMLPYQVLIWAEGASEYQYLKRISCFEVVSGKSASSDGVRDMIDIVGLWLTKTHEHGKAPHIGTGGPVPSQHPDFQSCKNPSELGLHKRFGAFEEANMRHFDIDGPGGEVVNEVHVSSDMKALKLVTNRARECYWGERKRETWHVKRANHGELIVGLSCCFGQLGGWSWGAKIYSHWKLSDVGVVTTRIGDGA